MNQLLAISRTEAISNSEQDKTVQDDISAADPDIPRIAQILLPRAFEKNQEVVIPGGRFVYYTTADTAVSILRRKEVWLRNTTAMNDYMEVEHGFECLNAVYNDQPGKNFKKALDHCFSGLASELEKLFNGWLPWIRQDTYMLCLSEHLTQEDRHGRLSMWRAYGGQTGVALVINSDVMSSDSSALGAQASPVSYLTPEEFAARFARISDAMTAEADYIRTLDREEIKHFAFYMLRDSVLCTKHPGFSEEREWRVVASPKMDRSELLLPSVEVVRGIPQTVLKLGLQNHPDQGVTGLALPELLDRIIIGPCEFPLVVFKAFCRLLEESGVPEPESKVVVSDIPLRHLGA